MTHTILDINSLNISRYSSGLGNDFRYQFCIGDEIATLSRAELGMMTTMLLSDTIEISDSLDINMRLHFLAGLKYTVEDAIERLTCIVESQEMLKKERD